MSETTSPSAVAREWFQKVWNERDASAIDRLMNIDANLAGISVTDTSALRGTKEFRVFHAAFLSALPDLKIDVTHVIEQGDWVSVRFVCTGTHTGEGIGVPPTGKAVHFDSLALARVENGQWVEGWNLIDVAALMQQVGGPPRIV